MGENRSRFIAAIDTETHGLNGHLIIAQMAHEMIEGEFVYDGRDPALEMLHHIFSMDRKLLSKTLFYAHNAEYDWRYLINAFEFYGDQFDFQPIERALGKFFEIAVLSKREFRADGTPVVITRFRDSYAVYNQSLANFTKNFAPNFSKMDIGLSRGVIFDKRNAEHIAYAKNDVRGLIVALQNFDADLHKNFHVHLGATFSSTAYNGWLRFAPEGEYHDRQPKLVEEFMRLAYYGGVVQINAPLTEIAAVRTFDRNSSYPAAMRLGVPKGRARYTRTFVKGFPGFYKCIATVPEDAILPIVPFRGAKDQLAWGRGTFETHMSSIEIEHCEARGCSFKIQYGYYFPQGLTYCFSEFIDACEKLRAEHKGKATEIVVKFMQNSVYGRFGMRKEGRECMITFDGAPDGFDAEFADDGKIIKHAYFKPVIRDTAYMLPHYAAWITANARIALDIDTEAVGRENVRYRDTDSISIVGDPRGALERCSKAYGALKDEGEKFNIKYHAPKCYTYKDAAGKWHAVYKGFTKAVVNDRIIEGLHNGSREALEYNSTTSLQTRLKTGKMSIDRTRRPTDPENIYGHVIEQGWFRPRFIRLDEPRAKTAIALASRPTRWFDPIGTAPRTIFQWSQISGNK